MFIVPGAPVPCGRPRVVPGKGAFTPKRTRDYQALARTCAQFAINVARWKVGAKTEQYAVNIEVFRATRRGDVDNYGKSILDALNGVAWLDDSQVQRLTVSRFDDPKRPRVMVIVERLAA